MRNFVSVCFILSFCLCVVFGEGKFPAYYPKFKDSKYKVRVLQKIHEEKEKALSKLEKDRLNLKNEKNNKQNQKNKESVVKKAQNDDRVDELENEVQELKEKLENVEEMLSDKKRFMVQPQVSASNKFSSYNQLSAREKMQEEVDRKPAPNYE